MTTYPLVQFVEAVGSYATRVDLNADDGLWSLADGFDAGDLSWSGDPGDIGGEYEYRTISIPLEFPGPISEAALALQPLARELGREESVLLLHYSSVAEPMWLRTYKTGAGGLDLEDVDVQSEVGEETSRTRLTLEIPADPFASLAPETIEVQLLNNPSGASSSVQVVNQASYPSAEGGTAGWASSSGAVVRTTAASGLVGRSGSWQYATSVIPAAGHVVNQTTRNTTAAGKVHSAAVSAVAFAAPATTLRMRWRWFNAANAVISTVNGPTVACGTTGVRLAMANQTAPASATSYEIGIQVVSVPGTAGALIWDALMATESTTVQPYKDGSSAGWGWSGQPHASTSGPLSVSTVAGTSHITLPPIKGDAPAECRVQVLPSVSTPTADTMLVTTAFDSPGQSVAPTVLDVADDDLVSGVFSSGLAVATAAAGYIGTGYRATSMAAGAGASAWWLGLMTVRPGSYMVLVRCEKAATSGAGAFRITPMTGNDLGVSDAIGAPVVYDGVRPRTSGASQSDRVPLGPVMLPPRVGSMDAAPTQVFFGLRVERLSAGSEQLRLDAIELIPLDAPRTGGRFSTTVFEVTPQTGGTSYGDSTTRTAVAADPITERAWMAQAATGNTTAGLPGVRGGFPLVHPGADNVLYAALQVGSRRSHSGAPTSSPDDLAATMTVRLEYNPQVTWLGTP